MMRIRNIIIICIAIMTFSVINAKAVTDESTTSVYYDIYTDTYIDKIKQLNIEKINANLDSIYENKKSQYPYYITIFSLSSSDGTGYGIYTLFFKNSTDLYYSIYSNRNSYYPRIYTRVKQQYYRYSAFYCDTEGSCSNWHSSSYENFEESDSIGYYDDNYTSTLIKLNDNVLINKIGGISDFLIYDTNIDNYVKNLPIDIKVGNKYYQSNDRFSTVREYLKSLDEPTVTLSSTDAMFNEQNIPVQARISAEWSVKDFSKYKYRFREINDTNWKYFFETGLTDEILVNKNGAYVFEIVDLNDNYVYGSSITVTHLNEELPNLKIDNYVSPACFYNDTQKICDIVTVYSDNADFSKYTLQYKLDDSADWITHNYENSVKGQIMIYKNTTVTARLIRNIDNKLVDSASYTVASINSEISIDKPTFKFDKTFCRNLTPEIGHEIGQGNFKETLKMTIYGLDLTKHKIYYSIDNANNFVELTELQDDQIPIIKHYMFEYYQDTKLIVKITDLDGNYITGMAYTLHFTCNDIDFIDNDDDIQDVDDVFIVVRKFFSKFKDIMLKIKEVIEYFYNSLNSEIRTFILTAFILIIVLNLIMRMMK